jgi:hypothetical protein
MAYVRELPGLLASGVVQVLTYAELPTDVDFGSVRFVVGDDTAYIYLAVMGWQPLSSGGGGGAVDSVNGQTGVVVLDTDDIPEGATNLYYTEARVEAHVFTNLQATNATIDTLTVTTATFLDSAIVEVGDNIIVLNALVTGAPTTDAGIEIERGTQTDAQLLWNETTDRWQFGLVGSLTNMLLRSDFSSTSPIFYDNTTGVFSLGTVPITLGGTGQSNAQAAINNLSNNALLAAEGDVFQWLGGNAQFAAYVAPGTTGNPNTLAFYDSLGDLTSTNYWTLQNDGRMNGSATFTGNGQRLLLLNPNVALGDTWNSVDLITGTLTNSGTLTGYVSLLNLSFFDDSSTTEFINGINIGTQGNTTNDKQLGNFYSSGNVGGNLSGLFLNSADVVSGNATLFNAYSQGDVTGQLSWFVGGNQVTNTVGSLVGLDILNNGAVSNFAQLIRLNSNGVITKGLDVVSANISGNVGDGSGVNLSGLNLSIQSTVTVDGNIFGLNVSNDATFTGGTNGFWGGNVVNQGAGYSYNGYSSGNYDNMTEQIVGFNHNTTGSSRTSTGLNITMDGNATDDAQGIRVNVNNQTSSTVRVRSMDISGHTFSFNNLYRPLSGLFVDTGNNNFTELRVANGSPVTGTDALINNNIVAFLVEDDIAIGPVGLGQAHTSIISLLGVADTKTIDLIRGLIVVASVQDPGYADAGTVDRFEAIVYAGALAGGGDTVINTAIGLFMPTGFDGYAGNNWGLRVQGSTADNYLNRLAIGTVSETAAVGLSLDVNGQIGVTAVGSGISIAEGVNAKMGVATLVAGVVTVSTTSVTATSRIFLTNQSASATVGQLAVANVVAGTSFDIVSSDPTETSTIAYILVEPS